MCLQADNPTPSAAGLDDDSVIDRMTQELSAATQGLPKGFKLQPVQFEKVRHCTLYMVLAGHALYMDLSLWTLLCFWGRVSCAGRCQLVGVEQCSCSVNMPW